MEFKVRLYINNKQVQPSDLSRIFIKNASIDKIVNDVAKRIGAKKDRLEKVS